MRYVAQKLIEVTKEDGPGDPAVIDAALRKAAIQLKEEGHSEANKMDAMPKTTQSLAPVNYSPSGLAKPWIQAKWDKDDRLDITKDHH